MGTNYKIASFWSRVLALFLDSFVLGISGSILGLIFKSQFTKLGNNGIFIGLLISLGYFTILNSKIAKGQTIGKKLLSIQLIDVNGNYLQLSKSFYRSLILLIPYFFINYSTPAFPEGSMLGIIKSITLSSVFFAVIIIYIFNSGNRQSLHDIAVGSFVISTIKQETISPFPKFSWSALYFTIAFIALMICISIYTFSNKNSALADILPVYNKLSNLDGVYKASISKNKQTVYGKETTTTNYYFVSLWVPGYPDNGSDIEKSDLVKKSIDIIFDNESNKEQFDNITIQLVKGYNIGISKWTNS